MRILTTTHFVPRSEILDFLFTNTGLYLLLCTLLWLAYIALEPAVRARWPHSLITWTRLLAGHAGDPRLGSHILVGVGMGLAMQYIFIWRAYWLVDHGASPIGPDLHVLLGARAILADDAELLLRAILFGSIMFFLLCGLRALLRKDWIAGCVAAVLLMFTEGTVQNTTHAFIDIPLYLLVYFTLAWLLMRMGLVTMIVTLLSVNMASRIPAFTEFSAWYNPLAVVEILTIGAIALYGFWRSQSEPTPASSA